MTNKITDDTDQQLLLARRAASGDKSARAEINHDIDPVIQYHTTQFCKRFCRENRYRYQCTLPKKTRLKRVTKDAAFCEWGNASYAWMLNDLTHSNRLLKYEGKQGASIKHYLYYIANSLPFYERWKDWRFGRRIHVPIYIQDLAPEASKVFYALQAKEEIPFIAQKLTKSEHEITALCRKIVVLLTQKKRLYLLDPPRTVSVSDGSSEDQDDNTANTADLELASYDESPELMQHKQQLRDAWQHLSAVEQFVLEAMLIAEMDAADILNALKKMNISIKQNVAAKDTNQQQLYYFRRKTLAKLADLMGKKQ